MERVKHTQLNLLYLVSLKAASAGCRGWLSRALGEALAALRSGPSQYTISETQLWPAAACGRWPPCWQLLAPANSELTQQHIYSNYRRQGAPGRQLGSNIRVFTLVPGAAVLVPADARHDGKSTGSRRTGWSRKYT